MTEQSIPQAEINAAQEPCTNAQSQMTIPSVVDEHGVKTMSERVVRLNELVSNFTCQFKNRKFGDDCNERHWLRLAASVAAILKRQPTLLVFTNHEKNVPDRKTWFAISGDLKEKYHSAMSGSTEKRARERLIFMMVEYAYREIMLRDRDVRFVSYGEGNLPTIWDDINEADASALIHRAMDKVFGSSNYDTNRLITAEEIAQIIRDNYLEACAQFENSDLVRLAPWFKQRIVRVYEDQFVNIRPVRAMFLFDMPVIYKELDHSPTTINFESVRKYPILSEDSFLGDLS